MARLARFLYRRRWSVLAATVVVLVASAVYGGGALAHLKGGGFDDPQAESTKAAEVLRDRFGAGDPNLVLLVTATRGTVDSPEVAAEGRAITERLAHEPDAAQVSSYWTLNADPLRSRDHRQALVFARIAGDDTSLGERTDELVGSYERVGAATRVQVGGQLRVYRDVNTQVESDLAKAEGIAVPITLLLLVLVFASAVAALLPLAVGGFAIVGTLLVLRLLAELTDVSVYALNLTTALGLGLAIDYSLFIVSRYREELRAGHEPADALAITMQTAGRTVLFGAFTVAAALLAPLYFLRSFGYAGIAVVGLAAVGALVVLPTLLALLGRRVDRLRLPLGRRRVRAVGEGFWHRLAMLVMRRPLPIATAVVVFLLLLGAPFARVSFGLPDDRVMPRSAPGREVAEPTRANGRFAGRDATWFSVVPSVDPNSPAGEDLVARVRGLWTPFAVQVTGPSAALVDTKASLFGLLPVAGAIIALITFVALFLMTGSVVLPVKALILNLLSLTAAYGAMVWIFQEGHLSGFLGFTPTGTIDTSMPVLLFCIAFGLSMDYEVFLLSRIKEEYDRSGDTRSAVAAGLERTGRIVTAAAALLAVVFLAFATSRVSFLQLFGLGTALAIVVDATLIRALLVPAFMRLAGRANWWAPASLRRFHARFGLSEAEPVTLPEPARAA